MRPRDWARAARAGLLAAIVATACGQESTHPAALERVVIPAGASFATITDSLVAHGIVKYPTWFKLLARARRMDRTIQAGVYEFPRASSSPQVLNTLAEGRVVLLRFTVPEGLTIPGVAELAAATLDIPTDSFTAAARDTSLLRALGLEGGSFEGYLFPETYTVAAGATARQVVRVMADNFLTTWQPAWKARLDTMRMTRHDVVILASIVQGEVVKRGEGPLVSAVYHNRLRRGMRLQADPTVQYAIQLATGERRPRLLIRDYQFPSPYNTYLHAGLPPGPIASPSLGSLEATLYPASVPYYFFVARGDGSHVFSRTYRQHLAAIAQIRGGADDRSP